MRQMKDSGVEWIGEIPMEWEMCRLKNYAKIMNGQDYKEVIEDNGMYPVMGSGGHFANASAYLYNRESVLLGRKGTIDKPIYVDFPFWTVDTMYYTIINEGCVPKYFYYLCSQINFQYYQYGSAVPSMTQRDLNNVYFPLPPLKTQHRIADYLDEKCAKIDTIIAKQQEVIEKLKEYKLAVITEAVTKGLDPDVPMKDSGIEWIGAIPEHWETYRIANLYDEISENGNDELPILTVSINSGVSDRELSDEESERVFVRSEDKSKYKRVQPGDLTYNMMRAWQGAFGAVRVDGMVSPAYIVARPKNNIKIDSRYIEYLMRTPIATEEMHRYSHGIADFRLRLYWPQFKNIRICLPDHKEQVIIADFIDKKIRMIDSTIEKITDKIYGITEYKKALIYEVVTGKCEV